MRKIKLICVGKTQDYYLNSGIELFEKKLKRFCSLSWVIAKEANYKIGNRHQWMDEELVELSRHVTPGHYTIACDESGKSFTSRSFAKLFQSIALSGHSHIDFVMGGAFGLPEKIAETADLKLSLSSMTFTHQMVRLFLVEQIYRAFTILNNTKYHHG